MQLTAASLQLPFSLVQNRGEGKQTAFTWQGKESVLIPETASLV